ncbi:hypothetical protein BH10PSE2_BH10PSE2_14020 [soil metagenome]
MDTTRIENRIGVKATAERVWEFLGDLETWNRWNPIETDAEGKIAFGATISVTERIEGLPERRITARIGDWQPYAQLVWREKRGFLFHSLRYYEIEELNPGNCIVSNGVIFSGLRGELFHDKHRRVIKAACIRVNEALRDAAEG